MSLKNISVGEIVKEIGDRAFSGCALIAEVHFPESIRSIGECVFEKCTSLKEVRYKDYAEKWENVSLGKCWLEGSSVTAIRCFDRVIPVE